MARLVLATFGSFGDIHPYMALALELLRRGHSPVIATTDKYQEKITAAGIEFAPVRPNFEVFGDERELLARVMHTKGGSEYVIREIILPHLKESYTDLLPLVRDADLAVSHPLSYAVPVLAEQFRKPWVGSVLQPVMFLSAYDPPYLPQGQTLAPLYRRSRWIAAGLFWIARNILMRGWDQPIQEVRRSAGLAPSSGNPIFEGQFSPAANLALFSPLLASPQPDWPANTTVTGFAFYDQQEHGQTLPQDLAAFLDAGPPPIVFTLGTSAVMVAGDFYQQSLQAAQRLNRRAVFLVGRDERNQLGPLPPGMFAAEYAPYSELFPRAAAVVHQGGAGTTGQAMRAGKPTIIVPFSHDQPDHAMRVNRLGISETVPRHLCTAARLTQALEKVLHNPRYAERAAQVGEQVRSETGVQTACDVLEEGLGAKG